MGAKSGPSGYSTNTTAIYHLLRHGFAVWSLHRMAVLLFHVERSTAYGKDSDQHSQAQAMEGIYSHTAARRDGGTGRWIRGRAGVSLAQWKRENRALLDAGLIRRIRRKGKNDADAASEYLPDWLHIRAALEAHEHAAAPGPQPLLDQPLSPPPLALPEPPPWLSQSHPLALPEPPPGSPRATQLLDLTLMDSTLIDCARAEVAALAARINQPISIEGEGQNQNQESAAEVQATIEAAFGRPLWQNDPIPGQVLAIAQRAGVPVRPLCMFLQEKAAEMQSNNYPLTSPKLFVAATANGLIAWAKSNRHIVESAIIDQEREAERRHYRAAQPVQMQPTPPPPVPHCPHCQEELPNADTHHRHECSTPTTARASGGS